MENYWLQWLVVMPSETALAIVSLIFGGVLERLPDLRIAFARSGRAYPALMGRLEHDFNVRPDLVAIQIESMDDFSAETKERLLAGTALEWLGQSKEMYTH